MCTDHKTRAYHGERCNCEASKIGTRYQRLPCACLRSGRTTVDGRSCAPGPLPLPNLMALSLPCQCTELRRRKRKIIDGAVAASVVGERKKKKKKRPKAARSHHARYAHPHTCRKRCSIYRENRIYSCNMHGRERSVHTTKYYQELLKCSYSYHHETCIAGQGKK